jgi:hypothetical protein
MCGPDQSCRQRQAGGGRRRGRCDIVEMVTRARFASEHRTSEHRNIQHRTRSTQSLSSKLPAPGSPLQAPRSRLPAPGSPLQAPRSNNACRRWRAWLSGAAYTVDFSGWDGSRGMRSLDTTHVCSLVAVRSVLAVSSGVVVRSVSQLEAPRSRSEDADRVRSARRIARSPDDVVKNTEVIREVSRSNRNIRDLPGVGLHRV